MRTLPDKESIFHAAAEIHDPADRQAYLDQACGGDPRLRKDVDELLRHDARAGGFMERPVIDRPPPTVAHEPVLERPGTQIGPYKLLQKIGEGGFGVVFMAEQERPVRRMVALKIIRPGMDTREVIARFESERQALALMDHPNIAKVLDAGATDSGRPYFAMELVKGVPITEFCDKNHMPAKQRLKLFIDVCHAILHAHHKGVIHRDIKPSNVMITLHDGIPVVKVIDFGVAKATVQKLTERTLFTAYGQMIGTPAYMSPEQAEMSGLDIDTRSDIYSLGVLLYELLTGTTPLEIKRLHAAGYAEMQRLIREEEAPRPSTRLSSLGRSATILAGNRGTDPKQLARLLSGDLDWIVMKALEKDRNRRYGTPGNLAEDLERYLQGEAILARPPSMLYKLKKFSQRNRVAVLTAMAVTLALVLGTVVATWQAVRANHARRDAEDARQDSESARREAEKARRETVASLYQALLGRAAAERQARAPGYRQKVWGHLRQAIALDVAESDTELVKSEVLECLPDFVGLDPVPAADIPMMPFPTLGEGLRDRGTKTVKWFPSRSGKLVAMVDAPRIESVSVWGANQRLVGTVESTVGHVHSIRIGANDELLAAACEEGFGVWSLPDLTPRMSVRGDSVQSVGIHPEGHLLVTRSQKGRVELWSLHSNRLLARFDAPVEANRADFSADGQFLVIAERDRGIHAWRVNGTPERRELAGHRGGVTGVVFSPDGKHLVSVSKDRAVKLWDANTGRLVRQLDGHEREVQTADFSPDGKLLATGDWASELRLWDPGSGDLLGKNYSMAGQIWRIRFARNGAYLLASGTTGVQGWEYSHEAGKVGLEPFHWRPGIEVRDIALLPTRSGYVSTRRVEARHAEIWCHVFGSPDQQWVKDAFFSPVCCLHFYSDGRLLYPAAPGRVGAFDSIGGKPTSGPGMPLREYYVSPDGAWLAGRGVESWNNPTRIYRATTGREEFRLPHDPGPIWCMAWAPDGKRLAIGYADGQLAIWNLEEVRARVREFGIEMSSTACEINAASITSEDGLSEAIAAERLLLDRPETLSDMTNLAARFNSGGWSRQAIALYEEALQRRTKSLGARDLDTLGTANNLAWLLAVAPDADHRNPARALELASQAVEGAPTNTAFRSTLATARYRNGDWKGTMSEIQQAIELSPGDAENPFLTFFLAMACHQLGRQEEARTWFDKAVAKMNQDYSGNVELGRIHREATTLFGSAND
jgi:serine/threonine protein kinase/WD40 repeat protein